MMQEVSALSSQSKVSREGPFVDESIGLSSTNFMDKKGCFIFRRKSNLINYRVQFVLILHTTLIAVITALVVHLSELSHSLSHVYVPVFGVVSTEILRWLPLPLLLICILWSFLLSNRIVGPIFNLNRHLMRTLEGKTDSPAHCRDSDYFKDLFVTVNKLLATRCGAKNDNLK